MKNLSERYIIKDCIGVGAFSKVFKGFDKKCERNCALKLFDLEGIENGNKSDYFYETIEKEIMILKECKCNNVVELYDYFITEEHYVLVLELCDNDLQTFVYDNKEYQGNLNFIQNIFIELNNAFIKLRENNVVHRDIKPQNILIKIENEKIIPKLCDFGISIIGDKLDFEMYSAIGTSYYMAPEISNNEKYNYKCDLFSLGITLYEMYFLKFPYKGFHKYYKFSILKSGNKSFDNLIVSLIQKNPKDRINIEDYLNHKFFKEDFKNLKNFDTQSIKIVNNDYKYNNLANEFIEYMDIPNPKNTNKIANIIYYDENIIKHLDEIHKDSDYFERKTPGTFILSSNIFSLNLIMEEIKKYQQKFDKRVIFNLIVTGSKFQKVMDNLINKKYDEFIQNICIYCIKIDKYSSLQKKYSKIIGIYDTRSQVELFIEKVSNENTIEFPMIKIINYYDYKELYHDYHEKISRYYGNLTKETYDEYMNKLINFIENEKDLKIDKNILINNFKSFEITEDNNLEVLKKIINEYTKNTIYKDLNNWLRKASEKNYEIIAYFAARLMYSLNNYGLINNNFFNEKKIIYRGAQTNYINLLPFERLKGKIIILSSFTSTSEDESIAIDFSGRKKSKEIFENCRKFSVIYKITNIVNEDNVSCGIDIQKESKYKKEKEILFQPFTFYLVKNVDFNFENYTVDIELETIPKKEILEEKIKQGKKVIYDKKQNLILIDEK